MEPIFKTHPTAFLDEEEKLVAVVDMEEDDEEYLPEEMQEEWFNYCEPIGMMPEFLLHQHIAHATLITIEDPNHPYMMMNCRKEQQ